MHADSDVVADALDLLSLRLRLFIQDVVQDGLLKVIIIESGDEPCLLVKGVRRVDKNRIQGVLDAATLPLQLLVNAVVMRVSVG